MKTIKSTGKEIWVLLYQWWDHNETLLWGGYDSLEALFFDLDHAYRDIAHNSDDDITDEKIAWARKELEENAYVEFPEIGLYMNIEPMTIYGLENRGE